MGRLQSLLSARSGPCGEAQRQPGPLPQRDLGLVCDHRFARFHRLHVPLHLDLLLVAALAGAAGQSARHAAFRRTVGLLQHRADADLLSHGRQLALSGRGRACRAGGGPGALHHAGALSASGLPARSGRHPAPVADRGHPLHGGRPFCGDPLWHRHRGHTHLLLGVDRIVAGAGHALGNRRTVRQGSLIAPARSMERKRP